MDSHSSILGERRGALMASIHSILIPSAQWRRMKEIRDRGRISESNELNSGVISNHGNGNVAHWPDDDPLRIGFAR